MALIRAYPLQNVGLPAGFEVVIMKNGGLVMMPDYFEKVIYQITRHSSFWEGLLVYTHRKQNHYYRFEVIT